MKKYQALIFIFILFSLICLKPVVKAQSLNDSFPDTLKYDFFEIDRIFIIGTKKTKDKIIYRELDFKEGDEITSKNISQRLKRNEEKLQNTRLFLTVNISLIEVSGNKIDVIIRLAERWYFFPIPVLELSDRNFQDWWVNQNHDFSRIEWGLKLTQYNVRGMNESLRLTGQFGYTKKFQVGYSIPSIDKKQKWGLSFIFDYRLNKNIFYQTLDHRHVFFDSNNWLKESFLGGVSTTYRKSFYSFHTIGSSFYYNHVNDTIVELNPSYYKSGQEQRYFRIYYSYVLDKRDLASYPLKGSYSSGRIEKRGLGIYDDVNWFSVNAYHNQFLPLGKNFYLTIGAGASVTFPEKQPYTMLTSMGSGRFTLRGYELYVIEGPQFVQSQWTIRKLLFKTDQNLQNILSARRFTGFHLALYLKSYFDMGYVNGYEGNILNTRFTDQFLYGGGIGIDMVTFYDIILRWEYSFNKDGESGLVFGLRSNF